MPGPALGGGCLRGRRRALGLPATAFLAACAWRLGPARSGAFAGCGTGSACIRNLRVLRRAEEQDTWGGNENLLSKQRPLPPDAQMFGDSVWFDITLKKPLGLALADGPDGPGSGVGVGAIAPEGSVPDRLKEILADGAEPGMWVQEGDELVQVNGEPTEGSQAKATQMIVGAGDSVTLTFSRPRRGYIKVVFPGGMAVTSPRGAILSKLAAKVGYDSGCSRRDGRCENCWYKDPATGEIYILPLNVPGIVPSVFRAAGEEGLRPGEGEFESWIPLKLIPAPEACRDAMLAEARANAKAVGSN